MTDNLKIEAATAGWSRARPPYGERHREHLLDQALMESFPASDPPSIAWPAPAGPSPLDRH